MPLAVAARARSAAPRRDAGRRPAVSDLAAFAAACKAEAAALITDHLGAVKAIADALVEHGELAGAEVDDIIAAALAREGLAEEQMRRQRKWHAIGASARDVRHKTISDEARRAEEQAYRFGGQLDPWWCEPSTSMRGRSLAQCQVCCRAPMRSTWSPAEAQRVRCSQQPFPIRSSCHRANSASGIGRRGRSVHLIPPGASGTPRPRLASFVRGRWPSW